ncbi:MAG TPA: hypothetical protein VM534_09100 [Thermoanaerobaculia bacterium]|nr:hypothetical protein [Thermoanaerobaculia bacterium]
MNIANFSTRDFERPFLAHQGFLTREALQNIAATTFANISAFERGEPLENRVSPVRHMAPEEPARPRE